MELIMKLVTRLVEALEKSAANSDKLVEISQANLDLQRAQLKNTDELLAIQKANFELSTSGIVSIAGEPDANAGLDPIVDGEAKQAAPTINDGGAQQHVSQAALDAAEAASKAAAAAKKAAADKAAADAAVAAVEAQRKADLEAAQAKQAAAAQPAEEKKKKVTVDDVRTALRGYASKHGNEAAMAVLQKHEAVSVSSMDPSKYEEVLKDLA